MEDEPWETYERDRTRSGWSYPIGRSVVEAALRQAGVRLLSLDFTQAGGDESDPVYLLRAARYADIGTSYHLPRGTPDRPRSTLTLFAVPSAGRALATQALTAGGGLHSACAWLARAEAAAPTWHDKAHDWTAYLRDGTLCVQETTR